MARQVGSPCPAEGSRLVACLEGSRLVAPQEESPSLGRSRLVACLEGSPSLEEILAGGSQDQSEKACRACRTGSLAVVPGRVVSGLTAEPAAGMTRLATTPARHTGSLAAAPWPHPRLTAGQAAGMMRSATTPARRTGSLAMVSGWAMPSLTAELAAGIRRLPPLAEWQQGLPPQLGAQSRHQPVVAPRSVAVETRQGRETASAASGLWAQQRLWAVVAPHPGPR